jgi:hypothetical protein
MQAVQLYVPCAVSIPSTAVFGRYISPLYHSGVHPNGPGVQARSLYIQPQVGFCPHICCLILCSIATSETKSVLSPNAQRSARTKRQRTIRRVSVEDTFVTAEEVVEHTEPRQR